MRNAQSPRVGHELERKVGVTKRGGKGRNKRRRSIGRLLGIHHRGLTGLRRTKRSPFRVAGCSMARRASSIGRLCGTRRRGLLTNEPTIDASNVSRTTTERTIGTSCRREEDVVSTSPIRMSVTKHVVFGHIVKGTSFTGVRSLGKDVRVCITHSTVKRSLCTAFGGSSVNSV